MKTNTIAMRRPVILAKRTLQRKAYSIHPTMDVMVVTLGAIVAIAGFSAPDVMWFLASE